MTDAVKTQGKAGASKLRRLRLCRAMGGAISFTVLAGVEHVLWLRLDDHLVAVILTLIAVIIVIALFAPRWQSHR